MSWRRLFRRKRADAELMEEIEDYMAEEVAENVACGIPEEEARRRARIKFGNPGTVREILWQQNTVTMIDNVWSDLKYAIRRLARTPGFAAVAILVMALGIGANTAIFSMVNALLLHPYNFRDLDRLVRVWEDRGVDEGWDARWIAPRDAADLRAGAEVFEGFTTYQDKSFNLAVGGGVQPVLGCRVSASFFDLLGISPAAGRTFTEAEEQSGRDGVAIVSHGFWQRRFGGDPGLLGRTIQLNQRTYTVVGIMPVGFSYPVPAELWTPLALTPEEKDDRSALSVQALGRLKDGVSVTQARAALEGTASRLQHEYPATNSGRTTGLLQLRKELYLYTVPMFGLLQAAAGFVLLLACANLGNLLFARTTGRRKEIAVRTALGAGRQRLARLFATEMLLLSTIAGAVAITVSFWSVKLLRTSISDDWTKWVPGWHAIRVDQTALAFAFLLAAAVGGLSGVATALHAGRVDPYATLKETGCGSMLGGGGWVRNALVVAQVMFALILLVCAGITAEGFVRLARVYEGFDPANVLRLEISLPDKSYSDNVTITAFYDRVLRGASALPGVSSAALITNSPASNVNNETTFFTIKGRQTLKASEASAADLQTSSPGYFGVLRIRLVAGREFSDADDAVASRVVVISKSMAARFWPRGDELDQQIKLGTADSPEPWMTVVGVVEDARQNWWNPAARPTIYEPFRQVPQRSMTILLRTPANPTGQVPAIREVVRQINSEVAIRGVDTMESEIADSIAIIRIMGILMAIFGGVALVLSSVGVYGVLAESVARRTPEIGIRLALGAEPRDVMKLVLGQAIKLTGLGLAIGLPFAVAANRAIMSLIFGVVSMNLTLLTGFAALLMIVALAAGYVPARRAMRVDSMVALRYE
jgi:putative ABC transport system permease protein